jgi:hypothetical protein
MNVFKKNIQDIKFHLTIVPYKDLFFLNFIILLYKILFHTIILEFVCKIKSYYFNTIKILFI